MIRRLFVFLFLVVLFHASVYLTFFKRDAAARAIMGYKKAETPQLAVENFTTALKKRDYQFAADYCTGPYGEQLKQGYESARKLGKALDDLIFQLNQRQLMRDELAVVLHLLDPFPTDVIIQISKSSADSAEARLTFPIPAIPQGGQPLASMTGNIPKDLIRVFVQSLPVSSSNTNMVVVGMKKEQGEWKFDFPVDTSLPARVAALKARHTGLVTAIETLDQEIKNDDTTKENVTKRFQELLEQANRE